MGRVQYQLSVHMVQARSAVCRMLTAIGAVFAAGCWVCYCHQQLLHHRPWDVVQIVAGCVPDMQHMTQ